MQHQLTETGVETAAGEHFPVVLKDESKGLKRTENGGTETELSFQKRGLNMEPIILAYHESASHVRLP